MNFLGQTGKIGLWLFGLIFGVTLISFFSVFATSQRADATAALAMSSVIGIAMLILSLFTWLYGSIRKSEAVLIAAIGLMAPVVSYFVAIPWMQRELESQIESCDMVADYGAKHFTELDRNGDRKISEPELDKAIERTDLSTKDRALLRYMREHSDYIGHCTGSHFTGGEIAIPDYGISREDLRLYPLLARERCKRWSK